MVPAGAFLTVTIAGQVPRSIWTVAPDPGTVQASLSAELSQEGLTVRALTWHGDTIAGGLFQPGYPYTASVTVQTSEDHTAAEDVAAVIRHAAYVAIGSWPDAASVAAVSSDPPAAPDLPTGATGLFAGLGSALQTDLKWLLVAGVVAGVAIYAVHDAL